MLIQHQNTKYLCLPSRHNCFVTLGLNIIALPAEFQPMNPSVSHTYTLLGPLPDVEVHLATHFSMSVTTGHFTLALPLLCADNCICSAEKLRERERCSLVLHLSCKQTDYDAPSPVIAGLFMPLFPESL